LKEGQIYKELIKNNEIQRINDQFPFIVSAEYVEALPEARDDQRSEPAIDRWLDFLICENGTFRLDENTTKYLINENKTHDKVVIVSIFGPKRTGKTEFMNRIIKTLTDCVY